MAILEVVPSWVKNANISFDPGGKATIRGTRGGYLRTDTPMSDMQILLSGAFLNSLMQHPDFGDAKLSNASIVFDESSGPLVPRWQCDFETRATDFDGQAIRPEGIPPQWGFSMGTHSSVEPVDRNLDGSPIITKTGEVYDPPLQDQFDDLVYIFTTEQIPLNRWLIARYRNKVNSDTFDGFPPGCCKMGEIQAQAQFIPGQQARMTCMASVFIRHPDDLPNGVSPLDAWSLREPARGYLIVDDETGEARRARMLDSDGNEKSDSPENYSDTPVLHSLVNGFRVTNPLETEFYHWRRKKALPFYTFFTDMLT